MTKRWIGALALTIVLSSQANGRQQNQPFGVKQGSSSSLRKEAGSVRTLIRGAEQSPWRNSGFYVIERGGPNSAPWETFFLDQEGYSAEFVNTKDLIPNTGKGGSAKGKRPQSFSVWLFPNTNIDTIKNLEDRIQQRQMAQEPLPTVLGSNHKYVLAVVGDLSDAERQVKSVAAGLHIPIARQER